MRIRHYATSFLVLVLAGSGLYFLVPAVTDYRHTQGTLEELNNNLTRQEEEEYRLREEISDLNDDPRAIERVAREKFGWCRDGEKIYHFDAPPPATASSE